MRKYAEICGPHIFPGSAEKYAVKKFPKSKNMRKICGNMRKYAEICGNMRLCGTMRKYAEICGPHNFPPWVI